MESILGRTAFHKVRQAVAVNGADHAKQSRCGRGSHVSETHPGSSPTVLVEHNRVLVGHKGYLASPSLSGIEASLLPCHVDSPGRCQSHDMQAGESPLHATRVGVMKGRSRSPTQTTNSHTPPLLLHSSV